MSKQTFQSPDYNARAFNCAHCNVYALQWWFRTGIAGFNAGRTGAVHEQFSLSVCQHCRDVTIWLTIESPAPNPDDEDEEEETDISHIIIYPQQLSTPPPADNTPPDVVSDYEEARRVFPHSARASAALLRLALQRLMPFVGGKGKELNEDIAQLVKNGLPPRVSKALDSVRVYGNNAVHPGRIDFNDKAETALTLFGLFNFIVEKLITEPKTIDAIFDDLPETSKEQVAQRDTPKTKGS